MVCFSKLHAVGSIWPPKNPRRHFSANKDATFTDHWAQEMEYGLKVPLQTDYETKPPHFKTLPDSTSHNPSPKNCWFSFFSLQEISKEFSSQDQGVENEQKQTSLGWMTSFK